ncbi:MAG: aryl-alcohol dehydrogenase-like predicted oxidoreductase [Halobacteriales archaeon]|jgi:aryl-alcohol dehydrogenase-like predicted oxidoreductase
MDDTTLGATGTTISRIGLGTASFGGDSEWTIDEERARAIVERALELGVTFFDTANSYANGEAEEILGDILAQYDRDRLVVASKVYFQTDEDDPNSGGLSRKTIEQQLARSLERLGMDTIDLYQIHRWDEATPIEETMRALDDAVRQGKVRYVGASSMWAHQFAEALQTSDRLGLERFVTMQNHYNLAYREEEREMLPLCDREGIGAIPWSPLARGYLARPHEEIGATTRGQTDDLLTQRSGAYRGGNGDEINERVQELADEKGLTMAQVALAWLLHKDWVDAPIVGTTSVEHLEEAVEAVDVDLTDSEVEYLEDPYEPVPVVGHE